MSMSIIFFDQDVHNFVTYTKYHLTNFGIPNLICVGTKHLEAYYNISIFSSNYYEYCLVNKLLQSINLLSYLL